MLTELLPFETSTVDLTGARVGLVIVDAGRGFTREGNLADPVHMVPMVERILEYTEALKTTPILAFLDTHHADIPEPPYPPHGILGTGEEDMDPLLAHLMDEPRVTVVRKDCINGFVGAIDRTTGANAFCDWVKTHRIDTLLVCGDCTDICVSDFVVSALSARNHGLLTDADPDTERSAYVDAITGLRIVVLVDACETFDAPGLHNREAAHHVGLWLMASRGAMLAKDLSGV